MNRSRGVRGAVALALVLTPTPAHAAEAPSPVLFAARERPHGRVAMDALDPRTLRTRGTLTLTGASAGVAAPAPDRRRVLLGTARKARGGTTNVLTLHVVLVRGLRVQRRLTIRTQASFDKAVWVTRRRALVLATDTDPGGDARLRVWVVDPLRGRVVRTRILPVSLSQTAPDADGLALLLDVGGGETTPRDLALLDAEGLLRRRVRVPLAPASGAWSLQRDPGTGRLLVLDGDRPGLAEVDLATGATSATTLPITGRSFSFVGPSAVASADASQDEGSGPGGVFLLRPGTHELLGTAPVAGGDPVSPDLPLVQDDLRVRAYGPDGAPRWTATGYGIGVGPYVYVSRFTRRGDLAVLDAGTGERLASRSGFRVLQIPSLGWDVDDDELPTS